MDTRYPVFRARPTFWEEGMLAEVFSKIRNLASVSLENEENSKGRGENAPKGKRARQRRRGRQLFRRRQWGSGEIGRLASERNRPSGYRKRLAKVRGEDVRRGAEMKLGGRLCIWEGDLRRTRLRDRRTGGKTAKLPQRHRKGRRG